jgi:hypothetical protein
MSYGRQRFKVRSRFNKLINEAKSILYYGSEVDTWLPELVLLPFIGLQWKQNPIWLRVIAPPSSGKSEHFSFVEDSEFCYTIDVFTPKAFISGFRSQEGRDPSILPQLNGKVVIISDESTIMEQSEKDRAEVQSILRKVFDGKFSKKFGNLEEKQEYSAHFNLLIGATPTIDRQFQYNQTLGERYINYRLQVPDQKALTHKAYTNLFNQYSDNKVSIKKMYCDFIRNLPDVSLNDIAVPEKYGNILEACANAIALIRTHINREKASHSVSVLPQAETAARLLKQMTQIVIADAVVRGDNEVSWEHLRKGMYIGLSSIKAVTIFILHHIINREKMPGVKGELLWFTPTEIHVLSALSRNTVAYILEDLAIHRILDIRASKTGVGSKTQYRLNEDARNLFIDLKLFKYYIPPISKIINVEKNARKSKLPPKSKLKSVG